MLYYSIYDIISVVISTLTNTNDYNQYITNDQNILLISQKLFYLDCRYV